MLGVGEPVGSVSLQGSELFDQRREVASSFGALPRAFQQVADYGSHCLYRRLRLPRFGLTPSMHDLIATLRMQLEGIPERLILDGVSGKGHVQFPDPLVGEVVVGEQIAHGIGQIRDALDAE